MAKPFHNFDDAMHRINRTICSYKGKPVYTVVDEMNGDPNLVYVYPLGKNSKKDMKKVKVTDDAFSYASLPLGYINYDGRAYYLERIPLRQTIAALSVNLIRSKPKGIGPGYFNSGAMEKCILGTHVPYEEALEKVLIDRAYSSCALSRIIAIGWNDTEQLSLYHRGRQIGYYDHMQEKFKLFDTEEFSFLKRSVDLAGVPT